MYLKNYKIITSLLVALFSLGALAGAHPHKGKLPKFKGKPSWVGLNSSQRNTLHRQGYVFKQKQNGNSGTAQAVLRVNAPASYVWSVITDFNAYKNHVDNLKSVKVYKSSGSNTHVRFKHQMGLFPVKFYTKFYLPTGADYMTWHLDYKYKSDADDLVGFWRVKSVSNNVSEAHYTAKLMVPAWVPSFIKQYLQKNSLKDATLWVKEEAERLHQRNH